MANRQDKEAGEIRGQGTEKGTMVRQVVRLRWTREWNPYCSDDETVPTVLGSVAQE